MNKSIKNLLTFDIEDWYHPNLTEPELLAQIEIEHRVSEPTLRILNMLDETDNTATFFVLGDVAEQFPELVAEMVKRGHEVASHGFRHNLVYNCTRDQYETDLSRSVGLLEGITGRKVLGYRAPSWSLNDRTPWAWEVQKALGLQYDSSLYPFKTFLYGSNESPRFDYAITLQDGEEFKEIPPSVAQILGKRVPFSGGFFMRVMPLWFIRRYIRQYNNAGQPAVLYLHPWEIDVGQPRLPVSASKRFILYANLERAEVKLRKLLEKYQFTSIRDHYGLSDKLPHPTKNAVQRVQA